MLVGLVFALLASLLNTVADLLESAGVRSARGRRLLTDRRYLAGLVVDGAGWVCTVIALGSLPVFVVQAVLGGVIALIALGSRLLYGTRLRVIDGWAIGACTVGLVLIAASAGSGRPSEPTAAVVFALLGAGIALAVTLAAAWSTRRAWLLAVLAGLGFGGTSVAVRAVHGTAQLDPAGLLSQPAVYAVLVFWAVGMVAYPHALARGQVADVTAVLQVTEILAPGAVGILLLGDTVRTGWWPVLVVGLALAVAGVVVLARSPSGQRNPNAGRPLPGLPSPT